MTAGPPPLDACRRALGEALARYRDQPIGVRGFVRLRHALTPLAAILREVPRAERMLDVGCGHGLFAHALAIRFPDATVLGIDPSQAKIDVATRSATGAGNVRFLRATVEQVRERDFDVVVVLDVLYLLPAAAKSTLLRACRERLSPDGLLLVKTNDTRPRWKYAVTRAQERAMTSLGLTLGAGELHFLGRRENARLIEESGFTVESRDLVTRLPYPAVLFLARPR